MVEVAAAVRRLARWVEDNSDQLADRVLARVRHEVPALTSVTDPALTQVERASTIANLHAIADGLGNGRVVPEQLPPGAIDLAVTLANRNAPWMMLLRRYTYGHAELWERVLEEVDDWDLDPHERTQMLQVLSRYLFAYRDYIAIEATAIYQAQRERLVRSREHRRIGLVNEMLDGLAASEQELGYPLRVHHVGMVAWGAEPEAAVTKLAGRIGGQLLFVPGGARSLWAWCGSSATVEAAALHRVAIDDLPADTSLALGAPAYGVEGFGRSHREAMQAFHIGLLRRRRLTHYQDVALEALALNDERLAREFAENELGPLTGTDERTTMLCTTLRVYFRVGQNRAAAATHLSVHERTVGYRLGQVEQLLGHPIGEREQELGVALRIHSLLSGNPEPDAV